MLTFSQIVLSDDSNLLCSVRLRFTVHVWGERKLCFCFVRGWAFSKLKTEKKNIYLKKWYASKQMPRYHTEEHSEEFLHIFCLTLNIPVIKIAPVSKKGRSSTFPCSHLTMSWPEIHTVWSQQKLQVCWELHMLKICWNASKHSDRLIK